MTPVSDPGPPLSFVPRATIGAAAWDDLVLGSPDGWLWSLSAWHAVIEAVERWSLQDRGFGVVRDDTLVAVVPLHWAPVWKSLSCTGWGPTCPAVRDGIAPAERAVILAAVFAELRRLASRDGAVRIDLVQPLLARRSLAVPEGDNPFEAFGFIASSGQSRIIDLSADEAALWAGVAKKARWTIRQARRNLYTAAAEPWRDHEENYYRVHQETYRRTGVTPHPRTYFTGIATILPPQQLNALLVGRSPAGEPVAYVNLARFGNTVLYHTGCSRTDHLSSGVNYLLMWEAIRWAKAAGCAWFEVGELFPAASDGKQRGLTIFKSRFGGVDHAVRRAYLTLPPAA